MVKKRASNCRTIYLSEDINPFSSPRLITRLMQLDQKNHEPIDLIINSPGGTITDCFAIYDVIQSLESEVNTICMGSAASAAAIVLATGTGRRYAAQNAEIMIHEPSGLVMGNASGLDIQNKRMQKVKETMIDILTKHTKQTREKIAKDIKLDMFFTPKEALEYGIIDEIGIPKIDMEDALIIDEEMFELFKLDDD